MGTEHPRAIERLGTLNCLDAVIAPLLAEIVAGATTKPPWPPFQAPTLGGPDLTIRRLIEA